MIKSIFTWIATLIGLVVVLVGSVGLINLGIKTFILTKADSCAITYFQPTSLVVIGPVTKQSDAELQCEQQKDSQRQSSAANDIAMILVGTPILWFFYKQTEKAKMGL